VALTLSDPFCVERHRDEFRALVEPTSDVTVRNEMEICRSSGNEFDDAVRPGARRLAGSRR